MTKFSIYFQDVYLGWKKTELLPPKLNLLTRVKPHHLPSQHFENPSRNDVIDFALPTREYPNPTIPLQCHSPPKNNKRCQYTVAMVSIFITLLNRQDLSYSPAGVLKLLYTIHHTNAQ